MITTVTGRNQVTIPADLARQLDIRAGTRLEWSKGEDGTLHARPLPARGVVARKLAGIGRAWLKPGQDPVADLIRERAEEERP